MEKILSNRPLVVFAIGLAIGLTFRDYPWNALFLVPLAVLLKVPKPMAASALGFVLGCYLSPVTPAKGVAEVKYFESQATIVSVPRLFPERISYVIETQGSMLSVNEPAAADRSMGDHLWINGLVKPLREGSEAYLLKKGVVGRLEPSAIELTATGPTWYRQAAQVRKYFVSTSRQVLGFEEAAILDALCFNVDGGLSDDFERDLRVTGTYHIISASGLHVFVLAWALDALLGLLPIPRTARLFLLGVILAFYAAAAGLQPAIVRSVLMSMVVLTAFIWRREADVLSALALAACAHLAFDPRGIHNMGFQLSFLTVAAFALFEPLRDYDAKTAFAALRQGVFQAFHTSHVAYWATLPLLAYYFGTVSVVAIPSNLVVVPVVSVLVVAGMATIGLFGMLPMVSDWLARLLLEPLISYLQWVLDLFSNLRIATLPGGYFNGYWLAAVYALILLMVRERVRPA